MRSMLRSCRQVVGKLRHTRVQLRTLPAYLSTNLTVVWVNRETYLRFIRRSNTAFSTPISRTLPLFSFYLYPLSTRPTKTTTSFLNLINY
jgi:hypothetical protein